MTCQKTLFFNSYFSCLEQKPVKFATEPYDCRLKNFRNLNNKDGSHFISPEILKVYRTIKHEVY